MSELIELPGIGRKTANAILIQHCQGIMVDLHVIRLLLWAGPKTRTPKD
jgi:endonuclease III